MDPNLYLAAMKGDLVFLRSLPETSNLELQLSPSQNTVLHVATEYHRVAFAVAAVHDCPALLWQVNSSGDTALHIAAREKHAGLVRHFISCAREKADEEMGESRHRELMRLVNLKKDTALHCAARSGSWKCVKLLAEADPEVCSFVNNADESPLYLCVASGVSGIHHHIINCARSSALYKGPRALTALHLTLLIEKIETEEIEVLVRWRPEMIREGDELGMTPLHYAAFYGKIEAIKLFLEYDSCAIYLLTNNGASALHIAAFQGHINALEELINCRPDCCNLVDNKGRTPLHAAVLGRQGAAVEFMLGKRKFKKLMNKQDYGGNTALHLIYIHKAFSVVVTCLQFNTLVQRSGKILNNEFSTPKDISLKLRGLIRRPRKSELDWVDKKCYMAMHQFAKEEVEEMNKEADHNKVARESEEILKRNNSGPDSRRQIAMESNLVVGALVATVTFTAGLTVPGGFMSNGSEDQGLAVLTNKAAFQAFTVFNTLAFVCSVFPVIHMFHNSLLLRHHIRLRCVRLAEACTTFSIFAMVLAFCSGTYVVLAKSTPLSLTPYIICAPFWFSTLSLLWLCS